MNERSLTLRLFDREIPPQLGVVLAYSLAALVMTACGGTSGAAGDAEIPSALELFPQASVMATEWQSDAHLIWAEVSMRPPPEVVFAFDSYQHPETAALVYVEDPLVDPSLRLEEVQAPGRTEARPAIGSSGWGILDSLSAYSIALDEGGAEFLEENPGTTVSWIRLQYAATPQGGGVVWRVTFGDPLAAKYDVLIEPATGEVVLAEESP